MQRLKKSKSVIEPPKVHKPIIKFTRKGVIMESRTPNARIFYTIDKSIPKTSGTKYKTILKYKDQDKITYKAVGFRKGFTPSDIAEKTYDKSLYSTKQGRK